MLIRMETNGKIWRISELDPDEISGSGRDFSTKKKAKKHYDWLVKERMKWINYTEKRIGVFVTIKEFKY